MLRFFRKYQTVAFSVVTFFIVISFAFFGVQGIFNSPKIIEEKDVMVLSNHRILKESDLHAMIRFLDTENAPVNPFNEGIIRKHFLECNLLSAILNQHPNLYAHFEDQKNRIQNFQPYVHPQGKAISAEQVWKHFSPNLWKTLEEIQEPSISTKKMVDQLQNLYLEEKKFPAQMLQRVLNYQQSQYQWAEIDPRVTQSNFSLFGFNRLSDWFGQSFLKVASLLIYQSAAEAEKKLGPYTDEYVLQHVLNQLHNHYRNEKVSFEEFDQLFHRHLHALGMTKNQLIDLSRTILYFEDSLKMLGSNLLVDLLPQKEMNQFDFSQAKFQQYTLPANLQFQNFHDLELFEIYRMAILPSDLHFDTTLPKTKLSVEKIANKFPKLVFKEYQIAVKEIDETQLALRIPLNDVYEWQVQDQNWSSICSQFLSLKDKSATQSSSRLHAIEKLDPVQKREVEKFCVKQIIRSHPEWLNEAFEKEPFKNKSVRIFFDEKSLFYQGINFKKAEDLISLLSKNPLDHEFQYDEGERHFLFMVKGKEETLHLSTFSQAKNDGVLEEYLEAFYKKSYPSIQKIAPKEFLDAQGNWKPFSAAKEQIGRYAFQQLLKSIDQHVPIVLKWKEGEGPLKHYVTYRFIYDFQLLKEKKEIYALDEFLLEKSEKILNSIDIPHSWIQHLQALDIGQFSDPILDLEEGMCVFEYQECLSKLPQTEAIGKKALTNEMKQMVMIEKLKKSQNAFEKILNDPAL